RKGFLQDYNLSIQGGTNTSRYYFGAGFTDQDALMKVINFSRASVKFNFDQKLSDKISFGLTNNLTRSQRNQARTGDGPQVSLWNSAISAATYTPKYAQDGTSVGSDNTYILMENYDVKTISLRYIGSIYGEAQIVKGLKFRTSFSLDYNHYDEWQYWNSKTSIGRASNGEAVSAITQNTTWINEQTLSYATKLNDHSLNLLAGNTVQGNTIASTYANGKGFANDNYKLISSASTQTSSQGWSKYTLTSFFGRVGYDYQKKYFAEATLRADASSKFGSNNRWGYFPAFSAAWRASEENFLNNVAWLSDLKLRASYGITGNQAGIDEFASKGLWSGGSSYADVVGTPLPGIGPAQLGNDDLKWEKTAQTNIGIDVGLFENRINITADYYNKYTTDLLLQQPIPSSSGFSTYWANVGEISNKGYEVNINTINVDRKNFRWSTNLNFSGNRNRIEKLPTQFTRYTRDWVIMKEGYSMNSFWLYKQIGVDPENGKVIFEGQDENAGRRCGSVTNEREETIQTGGFHGVFGLVERSAPSAHYGGALYSQNAH
ncbi:MAG: SusC/RagA family TonB-linked outer membrane protein, partial [Chitinophagaceae bacterium]